MDYIKLKKFMLAINGFGGFAPTPKYTTKLIKDWEDTRIYVHMWWPSENKGYECFYFVGFIEINTITERFEFVSAPEGWGCPYSESAKDDIIDFLEKLCNKYNNLNQCILEKN